MGSLIANVIRSMVLYNESDPKRVHHALKVYAFAKSIGELEALDDSDMEILELAAVLHDIGIRNSELKYSSSSGKYQELEGPPVAEKILAQAGVQPAVIERVLYLIAHHHTYTEISGMDYQILVEADFLVNLYEDGLAEQQAQTVLQKYFKTKAGKEYLTAMYLK